MIERNLVVKPSRWSSSGPRARGWSRCPRSTAAADPRRRRGSGRGARRFRSTRPRNGVLARWRLPSKRQRATEPSTRRRLGAARSASRNRRSLERSLGAAEMFIAALAAQRLRRTSEGAGPARRRGAGFGRAHRTGPRAGRRSNRLRCDGAPPPPIGEDWGSRSPLSRRSCRSWPRSPRGCRRRASSNRSRGSWQRQNRTCGSGARVLGTGRLRPSRRESAGPGSRAGSVRFSPSTVRTVLPLTVRAWAVSHCLPATVADFTRVRAEGC